MAGGGCHLHMTLIDRKTGRSAFLGDGVSKTLGCFTEGILEHAKALMPLIGPTPNCYRHLKPHAFAPSNISWRLEDRTAMVRLKDIDEENAHAEMRAPAPGSPTPS